MILFSAGDFKKYFQNTGFLLLEKVARMFVGITVWAYVARYLHPQQFGIFNYVFSYVFLFRIFSVLGLDSIVVRDLLKKGLEKSKILGTVFVMKLFGAILAIFLISFTTQIFVTDSYTRILIILMSCYLIFLSFNTIDLHFQSMVKSKYVVFSQLWSLVVTSILCVAFVNLRKPLEYFIYVVIIEAIVFCIALNIIYRNRGYSVSSWEFDLCIARGLFKDSWPLIISGIAISIYMRIDQIMIKEILGATFLGYYSAAIRVSEVFYFLPTIITASLFPAIVKAKMYDEKQYRSRLQFLFSTLFFFAVVISLVLTVLAKPIIAFLYGKEYVPSIGVLCIHAWANIFVFWGVLRTKWAVNENLQIYIMVYTIIGALSNIALNLIFIPLYGVQGAAVATLISQFLISVLFNLISHKTRGILFLQFRALNIAGTVSNCLNIARKFFRAKKSSGQVS